MSENVACVRKQAFVRLWFCSLGSIRDVKTTIAFIYTKCTMSINVTGGLCNYQPEALHLHIADIKMKYECVLVHVFVEV